MDWKDTSLNSRIEHSVLQQKQLLSHGTEIAVVPCWCSRLYPAETMVKCPICGVYWCLDCVKDGKSCIPTKPNITQVVNGTGANNQETIDNLG